MDIHVAMSSKEGLVPARPEAVGRFPGRHGGEGESAGGGRMRLKVRAGESYMYM